MCHIRYLLLSVSQYLLRDSERVQGNTSRTFQFGYLRNEVIFIFLHAAFPHVCVGHGLEPCHGFLGRYTLDLYIVLLLSRDPSAPIPSALV